MNDNDKIILDEFTERIWDATLSFIIEIDKYKLYEEYLKEVHNIDLKINKKVSFDYSVSCSRNPVVTVGNELPSRVTKEDVRINLSIAGEDVGDAIGITGNYAALNINVFDTYGDSPLAVFGCTGQVFNQNLAVSEGGYIDGTISVSQEYLTGRVFY